RGILYTLLATIAWVIFYRLMKFLFGCSARYLEAKGERQFPYLRLFNFDLLTPAKVKGFVIKTVQRTHLIVGLIGLYFYLAFVFQQFVWTERFGNQLVSYTLETLGSVWKAFIDYLPNLINIAITAVIVYYVLAFLRFIANRMEAGELKIPGFYQDWIRPTYRLVATLVLALAFM
ncbi:MAG: hypothetical protein NZ482_10385, partial [Gloeomargarita sp. SKYG98]|nr:hypothetical protein [Gloeomargarita sp. SKYG98]